jgi:hypothetical protein
MTSSGVGQASIYTWSLLASPMIMVLNETFPDHTFFMNISKEAVATFIAAVGILSVIAQTGLAFACLYADAGKQGMITGMRGLCNGLGPAMFGLIFSLFNVNLNEQTANNGNHSPNTDAEEQRIVPGPPFVFGSLLVILAILVAAFIPDNVASSSATYACPPIPARKVSLNSLLIINAILSKLL